MTPRYDYAGDVFTNSFSNAYNTFSKLRGDIEAYNRDKKFEEAGKASSEAYEKGLKELDARYKGEEGEAAGQPVQADTPETVKLDPVEAKEGGQTMDAGQALASAPAPVAPTPQQGSGVLASPTPIGGQPQAPQQAISDPSMPPVQPEGQGASTPQQAIYDPSSAPAQQVQPKPRMTEDEYNYEKQKLSYAQRGAMLDARMEYYKHDPEQMAELQKERDRLAFEQRSDHLAYQLYKGDQESIDKVMGVMNSFAGPNGNQIQRGKDGNLMLVAPNGDVLENNFKPSRQQLQQAAHMSTMLDYAVHTGDTKSMFDLINGAQTYGINDNKERREGAKLELDAIKQNNEALQKHDASNQDLFARAYDQEYKGAAIANSGASDSGGGYYGRSGGSSSSRSSTGPKITHGTDNDGIYVERHDGVDKYRDMSGGVKYITDLTPEENRAHGDTLLAEHGKDSAPFAVTFKDPRTGTVHRDWAVASKDKDGKPVALLSNGKTVSYPSAEALQQAMNAGKSSGSGRAPSVTYDRVGMNKISAPSTHAIQVVPEGRGGAMNIGRGTVDNPYRYETKGGYTPKVVGNYGTAQRRETAGDPNPSTATASTSAPTATSEALKAEEKKEAINTQATSQNTQTTETHNTQPAKGEAPNPNAKYEQELKEVTEVEDAIKNKQGVFAKMTDKERKNALDDLNDRKVVAEYGKKQTSMTSDDRTFKALDYMIETAERNGDTETADHWRGQKAQLEKRIKENEQKEKDKGKNKKTASDKERDKAYAKAGKQATDEAKRQLARGGDDNDEFSRMLADAVSKDAERLRTQREAISTASRKSVEKNIKSANATKTEAITVKRAKRYNASRTA